MTEKNLIPFDLIRYKAGEKVQTRDGRKVLQIEVFNHESLKEKIVAYIDGRENLSLHRNDGTYYLTHFTQRDHELDLFMAPKIQTFWINIYKHKNGNYTCSDPLTEKQSQVCRGDENHTFIKSFTVEIEV